MVLIADAHVRPDGASTEEFFRMLEALAASPHDVVFLGDIVEFWIALPRYENALHAGFLEWCRREVVRRRVGYVEGNHEFFVRHSHADAFSFVACNGHADGDGTLFVHGDTVKQGDLAYRLFRGLTRSTGLRWAEQVAPFGPAVAARIKRGFEKRAAKRRRFFPKSAVESFAARWFARGITTIWMGHFHDRHVLSFPGGKRCEVVPAWQHTGSIVLSTPAGGEVRHWREVLGGP